MHPCPPLARRILSQRLASRIRSSVYLSLTPSFILAPSIVLCDRDVSRLAASHSFSLQYSAIRNSRTILNSYYEQTVTYFFEIQIVEQTLK